jgi:predicted O-linked N-acetylglucosamine transferase (SPINDLY family)
MGVPVVTMTGNSYASRTCTSVLRHLGLPELIAGDQEQYVSIAAELARDRDRLVGLRQSLRQRMLDSVITDGAKFTANLENAFRDVWKKWCANG